MKVNAAEKPATNRLAAVIVRVRVAIEPAEPDASTPLT